MGMRITGSGDTQPEQPKKANGASISIKNGKLDIKAIVKSIIEVVSAVRPRKELSYEENAGSFAPSQKQVRSFVFEVLQNKPSVSTVKGIIRECQISEQLPLVRELVQELSKQPKDAQKNFWMGIHAFMQSDNADQLQKHAEEHNYEALAKLLPTPEKFAQIMKITFSHPAVLNKFEKELSGG